MKFIYLDQFAISGLSDTNITNNWTKIFKTLLQLKKQNKICCCTSIESVFETSQRNNNGITANYKLIYSLLDNCFLYEKEELILHQIAKNIKGINYKPFKINNQDFKSEDLNTNIKSTLYLTFDKIETPIYPVNTSKKYITEIIKILQEKPKLDFINEINMFLLNKKYNSYYYKICISLKNKFNFNPEDFSKLSYDIYTNSFDKYPTLKIFSYLYPFIFFSDYNTIKHNIKFKNDLIDIRRISSAIPYCDVVFCDNKWKQKIKLLKLDNIRKSGTLLYTASNNDLDEFYKYLLRL